MKLSNQDKLIIKRINDLGGWVTQNEVKSCRQTMNKLVQAGILERKLNYEHTPYMPESGSLYRLKNGKGMLAFSS